VTGVPPKPLAGRRIVVTRRPEQSAALCERLRDMGATVVELPLIELAPPADITALDEALRRLDRYDWVVFTSANAVRSVSDRMTDLAIAESALTRRKIAAIGTATTRALHACFPGAAVSVEPARHDAEALLAELRSRAGGLRFLLPASDVARATVPDGLRAAGAAVDVVIAYRTVAPAGLRDRLLEGLRRGADLVTFASPSSVENLVAAAPELVPGLKAGVIGPVTEQACRAAGIDVLVVAAPSTAAGLATAIDRHFRSGE